MYFTDINALKTKLKTSSGKSDSIGFTYFWQPIALVMGCTIIGQLLHLSSALVRLVESRDTIEPVIDIAAGVGFNAVLLWGIHRAYKHNGSQSGTDFFNRLFPVGWVIGCRFFIIPVVVLISLAMLSTVITPPSFLGNPGTQLVIRSIVGIATVLYWALYWKKVGEHIRTLT